MKKNRFNFLYFLILPLLLLLIHAYFTRTIDNYKNPINIDPDYQYLISSIDLSKLELSKMVLHPGTTVQVISHLVMKCTYLLTHNSIDDFQTTVLKEPVSYLNVLHHTFSLLNILLILLMGLCTWHITGNIWTGLLMQSTPFLSSQTLIFGFRKITADVVLVSICLILALILIKILHTDSDRKKTYIFSIALGLISGFGLATKIPFIVLLIIPFIIMPSWQSKLVYILSTAFSALVFTLPIASRYFKLMGFLKKIGTHSGIYGHGKKGIIDVEEYILNFAQIIKENLPFIVILLVSIAIIIFTLISSEKRKAVIKDIQFKMLFSITIAQIFGILMVARHFKSKYLIPVFCLSSLSIYIIFLIIRHWYQDGRYDQSLKKRSIGWLTALIVIFLSLSFWHSFHGVAEYQNQRAEKLKESIEIQRAVENGFKDYGVVYYYNASSILFGLEFGNRWTPAYTDALKELYGDRYFYHHFQKVIYNWSNECKISLEALKTEYDNKLIFMGTPFHKFRKNVPKSPFPLRDVFEGEHLAIYELVNNEHLLIE